MNSPFRNRIDKIYTNARTTQKRWKITMKFLAEFPDAKSGLDLGDRTSFTEELESFFDCPFTNSTIDLDIGSIEEKHDIITAFEVIEHLFNPLHCLLEVRNSLNPNGRLYLSTPKSKPKFLSSPEHFHEMTERSLEALFKRAKFKVARKISFSVHSSWFYLTGIRPLLRSVFDRHWLFELIPFDHE